MSKDFTVVYTFDTIHDVSTGRDIVYGKHVESGLTAKTPSSFHKHVAGNMIQAYRRLPRSGILGRLGFYTRTNVEGKAAALQYEVDCWIKDTTYLKEVLDAALKPKVETELDRMLASCVCPGCGSKKLSAPEMFCLECDDCHFWGRYQLFLENSNEN